MKPGLGFFFTFLVGLFYTAYGLFTSWLDLGIGMAVAGIGFIGWDYYRWDNE